MGSSDLLGQVHIEVCDIRISGEKHAEIWLSFAWRWSKFLGLQIAQRRSDSCTSGLNYQHYGPMLLIWLQYHLASHVFQEDQVPKYGGYKAPTSQVYSSSQDLIPPYLGTWTPLGRLTC